MVLQRWRFGDFPEWRSNSTEGHRNQKNQRITQTFHCRSGMNYRTGNGIWSPPLGSKGPWNARQIWTIRNRSSTSAALGASTAPSDEKKQSKGLFQPSRCRGTPAQARFYSIGGVIMNYYYTFRNFYCLPTQKGGSPWNPYYLLLPGWFWRSWHRRLFHITDSCAITFSNELIVICMLNITY